MALEVGAVLEFLECGDLEVLGRLPYASNATLLARVRHDGIEGLAVYKPRRGESPLWDFPPGTLCLRERAAFLIDAALGWGLVPPTVLRDAPLGVGAVQLFVDEDDSVDDLDELLEAHEDKLRRIAAFDVVANNADRKAGHCLLDRSGRLWAIDHGVTFNVEHKLRTVLWAFAGDALAPDVLSDLKRLAAGLQDGPLAVELARLLHASELRALEDRVDALAASGRFPHPGPGRRHIPWPPW